jgi:hypothetical protein
LLLHAKLKIEQPLCRGFFKDFENRSAFYCLSRLHIMSLMPNDIRCVESPIMDWWALKQLRAHLLSDLAGYIPAEYFSAECKIAQLNANIDKTGNISSELKWGCLATTIGKRIFYEPPANISARQIAASEVLMHVGMLVSAEAAHQACIRLRELSGGKEVDHHGSGLVEAQLQFEHIPVFCENIKKALCQYLKHLSRTEVLPYIHLIGDEEQALARALDSYTPNVVNINGPVAVVQTGNQAKANIKR